MSRINLRNRIEQGLLLLDGAMGTQLFASGITAGVCNEYLCIERPEIVRRIHADYLTAGSHAVLTNTFAGTVYALGRHNHDPDANAINMAAAKLAREAAGDDNYVLGDIGPCGDFLEPLGSVNPDKLKADFARQVYALAEGAVDGFIVETMTALEEAVVAVEAARSSSDLPVFVSLSYDSIGDGSFRTMMGVSPETAVKKLLESGPDAIGFNCGNMNMSRYIALAQIHARLLEGTGVFLLAEPNAGKPELTGSRAVYNLSPEDYAKGMAQIVAAGARIVGGCCGTTPAHIEALAKKLLA